MRTLRIAALVPTTLLTLPLAAHASDGEGEYHPYVHYPQVRTVDMSEEARAAGDYVTKPVVQPDFYNLDTHILTEEEINAPVPQQRTGADALTTKLPDGWVQRGSVVLPADVANGLKDVGTGPIFAVEDIPGNKYPRKHTLFLNFGGGMLFTGTDNSAEDRSTLAKQGVYPTFGGGESVALSIIQAVEADFAPYGIRVIFDYRPRKVVPYTMEMVGGTWQDTNIDSPAGGVAPGADCGALGQRHVVYTFSNGGSVLGAASTISQEAGHAYGLDHTFDCSSVMSYCGGGDKSFREGCQGLCEAQCQGPNSAGCRLTHEMFCGEGNDQQDDAAEMAWIFGGNEPDMEPPTVDIQSPADGDSFEVGANVELRAVVDDNYGGFGWKYTIVKDGEVVFDQPDYDRDVDAEFRAALNLSNLEEGVWEMTVEVEDQYEHVTSQTVTITVGDAVAPESTGSDSDGGGDGSTTDDSDSGTGGSDDDGDGESDSDGVMSGSGSGGADQMGDDSGGCSVDAHGRGNALWLLLGLLPAAIRRRGSRA
ncbi:MAG: hypothetical protein AAGA54_32280 [Myxococcota bacterium]